MGEMKYAHGAVTSLSCGTPLSVVPLRAVRPLFWTEQQ